MRSTSFPPHVFSGRLASRIFAVVGVATMGAVHASCGGKLNATVSTGGAGGATTSTSQGSGGAGASSGAGFGGGGLIFEAGISTDGLGLPPPGTECLDWPDDAGDCPTDPTVVIFEFDKNGCWDGGSDLEPATVDSGPTRNAANQCCYVVEYQFCLSGGRPYLVDEQPRTAPSRRGEGHGWSAGERPLVAGLTASERASLAAAWTADALLEHASVASFSRFSLALLAAGAPADLVEAAHRAALDEVRHAQICFALATAYAGESVAPGPFPLGDAVDIGAGLAALAASTVREACVGETVAAMVAAEQLARATDPAVRAALAEIAEDEARHAELGWRTVAWAIQRGGSEVRAAVEEAFRGALAARPSVAERAVSSADAFHRGAAGGPTPLPPAEAMARHGRLDATTTAKVVAAVMADIVAPAARALLRRCEIPEAAPHPGSAAEGLTA